MFFCCRLQLKLMEVYGNICNDNKIISNPLSFNSLPFAFPLHPAANYNWYNWYTQLHIIYNSNKLSPRSRPKYMMFRMKPLLCYAMFSMLCRCRATIVSPRRHCFRSPGSSSTDNTHIPARLAPPADTTFLLATALGEMSF